VPYHPRIKIKLNIRSIKVITSEDHIPTSENDNCSNKYNLARKVSEINSAGETVQ
jgi:hypothetical protein